MDTIKMKTQPLSLTKEEEDKQKEIMKIVGSKMEEEGYLDCEFCHKFGFSH
jgi:hypothetical protein